MGNFQEALLAGLLFSAQLDFIRALHVTPDTCSTNCCFQERQRVAARSECHLLIRQAPMTLTRPIRVRQPAACLSVILADTGPNIPMN